VCVEFRVEYQLKRIERVMAKMKGERIIISLGTDRRVKR